MNIILKNLLKLKTMKRTIYLIAAILITNLSMSQTQCVWCNNNTVDSIKFASAIGSENISTGLNSFAGGFQSEATGDYSFAFGDSALSTSLSSIALGTGAEANGWYSVAIGRNCKANDGASFALGYHNIAQAGSSYLFGEYLKSAAGGSVTIGMGAGIGEGYLKNNIAYSLMVGFNSDVPTFFVGGSSGIGTTGKIGIGNITEPEAKLHILGDAGLFNDEDASLFIQSSGNYYSTIWLGDKDHSIMAKPDSDITFRTSTDDDFIFENGNVGIGVSIADTKLEVGGKIKSSGSNSALILESPDGTEWEITIDNSGNLSANQITAVFEAGSQNDIYVYPNPTENKVTIDLQTSEIKNINIELFDLSGKMVFMKFYRTNIINLDLNDFESGTYILKLKDENGNIVRTEKIIKE